MRLPTAEAQRGGGEAIEQARRDGLVNTIRALAGAVDVKDRFTQDHSRRVATFSARLAEAVALPAAHVERPR